MQLLDLEIKLASLAKQIMLHNVEVSDRRPERPRYFRQGMKPATVDTTDDT